jgi:DNA polymerase III sliding clamp (beta) subunit (PCNA family)
VTTTEHAERVARFTFADGRVILARVTDSQFPPYSQVIPQRSEHRATLNRKELLQAVKVAQASASAKTGFIVLTWSDRLTITASNPEKGSASIEVETIGKASGNFEPQINDRTGNDDSGATIGFCAKYVVDALAMHDDATEIACEWTCALDPMTIRDASNGRALALIMPMRL